MIINIMKTEVKQTQKKSTVSNISQIMGNAQRK
jgi:hypothetical protein